MINIYRSSPSESANELVDALNEEGIPAKRVRKAENIRQKAGDRVISWGSGTPVGLQAGILTLNTIPIVSKLGDAQKLTQAGIATITASERIPAQTRILPRPGLQVEGRIYDERGAQDLLERLRVHLSEPLPTAPLDTWLARRNNHMGGSDLLHPPVTPDFWVKKEIIVEEYRLHSFAGKSIRAGVKKARPDAHPWIRSLDAGWVIHYADFKSSAPMRALAASAITALGLDFGAVDLAKRADGSLFVLEVNRAPGIEGGTVDAYVEAIRRWTSV